jgi:uncharacterized protein YndB with AHSA1/START domain
VASYVATVNTKLPPERAFALMSDFANAEGWDPATHRSSRVGTGPVELGARFELEMRILGRENSIFYEIVEFDPPRRVVLRGENGGSVSVDEISVAPDGSGSAVTYAAEVTMKGAFKAIAPIFAPVFKRMGDEARDAIGPWLDAQADASP